MVINSAAPLRMWPAGLHMCCSTAGHPRLMRGTSPAAAGKRRYPSTGKRQWPHLRSISRMAGKQVANSVGMGPVSLPPAGQGRWRCL